MQVVGQLSSTVRFEDPHSLLLIVLPTPRMLTCATSSQEGREREMKRHVLLSK